MAELNHTIVLSHDKRAGATYLTEILGLAQPQPFGPFQVVETANGVSLDYLDAAADTEIASQHYAFLVSDAEFDAAFARIRERGGEYWADPGRTRAGEINTNDRGRGVYFEDPSGHLMEILTVPYGG
ncbi:MULTISPECIES: VOC family protein [Pseudonocardia]|nr:MULTISPECIES: VOC family protein [Pseudonocardia]